MPVVRRIRKRGATITVESHAEILFMPSGEIHNWANRFTGRIRAATITAAPTNKRPRWAHYGKPLKTTIVSARPRFWGNGRDRQRVYGAVGSTSPHAYYVDQGTGVYGGRGPYKAKILPPWFRGSPSLYEATWQPNGPGRRKVKPVMIKGQRAQHFFDKGLSRAFASMRMRSYQVPDEPSITAAENFVATGLENFIGNTIPNAAFRAQLDEWRLWRDEAWAARRHIGGQTRLGPTRKVKRHRAVAQQVTKTKAKGKPRTVKPTKAPLVKTPKVPKESGKTLAQRKQEALNIFRHNNPSLKIIRSIPQGIIVDTVQGPHVVTWSQLGIKGGFVG